MYFKSRDAGLQVPPIAPQLQHLIALLSVSASLGQVGCVRACVRACVFIALLSVSASLGQVVCVRASCVRAASIEIIP